MTIKQQGGIFGRNPTFNQVNVDDGGKIVVGTDGDLEIYHSGTQTYIQENGTGDLRILGGNIRLMNAAGNETFITCIEDDYVALRHNNNEKLRTVSGGIDVSGNVILDSGSGIDFSATSGTGTSELFDDYEEGTWSPVISDAASGGNTASGTFVGFYTKIGREVFVKCFLSNINTTGMTGGNAINIQGLPFTAASIASPQYFSASVYANSLTFSGYVSAAIFDGTTQFRLYDIVSATGSAVKTVSSISSGVTDVWINISYFV